MPTIAEASANTKNSTLAAELAQGVNLLSGYQVVVFTPYVKLTMPLDGFVFWVNYSLIPNSPLTPKTIQGSLHYATEVKQEEESTLSYNTMVFTALSPCDIFNQIDPQILYIASYNNIRFAFSSTRKFYQQADLYHYNGVAITAGDDPQIIDTLDNLNSLKLIVSNSLPIWLAMPSYTPPYPGFTCPIAKMYPSMLVPENCNPPYASVHIEETTALASSAFLGRRLTSSQLTKDKVRVTTFGVNNDDIITFLNFVNQYSYDWNYIGMMNMPIIVDEKQTSPETETIAQKKTIEFEVSYLQETVRDIYRQFIHHCIVSFVPPTMEASYKATMYADESIDSGSFNGTVAFDSVFSAIENSDSALFVSS